MAERLHYEDVAVGMDIPALTKNPSTRQLVKWAGASGDFNEIHYDQSYAHTQQGLPDIIVHGRLKGAFLIQMVTDWIGEGGRLRKLSIRYREVDFPREQISCRGRVSAKYHRDGQYWVECDVWTENPKGQQTTTGSIAVTLPSRG